MPLNTSLYGAPFKVMGQDVIAFTPIVGEICLEVPWSSSHYPDENEMANISRRSVAIVTYCQHEGIFNPRHCDVGIYLRTTS